MHYSHQCFAGSSQRTDSGKRKQASRQPRLRYSRLISLRRLPAPKPAERNGVTANTEVEVPAAGEATAMEMVTDMATGIATGTITEMETGTGMVMDVVTETAMAMAMATEMATTMAMEMATATMEVAVVAIDMIFADSTSSIGQLRKT
ncbi:hypothetical protein CY35_01G026300 [Sphagnum magellanicum]|nr:hypothetical protein CY35_01G026300 [Sphagnum magellanicum]